MSDQMPSERWDYLPDGAATLDGRAITMALLVVADELQALRETRAEVQPGPCWEPAGLKWPNGVEPRCELRAGHIGAHECDWGDMGGTAVWPQRGDA